MNGQWREGNSVKLLINGEEFFPSVFECIRNARHEVVLETFIFFEDKVGILLQRELVAAAKRGVRVEVTVDDYGSADLSEEFVGEMTDAGVHLHVFDPTPRLLGVRVNLFRRLHRKIVVVDAEIAFVGGINYAADHMISFGANAKQDYAVQVRGPILQDIHEACWNLLKYGAGKGNQGNLGKAGSDITPVIDPAGDVRMQFVMRDNIKHKNDIEKDYIRAIYSAKRRLIIANAYFFPGYRLLRAMRRAAKRGVDVTLVLQGRADMRWVAACTRLLYEYLLRGGVTIYEYCKRPLHGKVALVDEEWATVGSSNLDPLSLALNLEANLMIEDKVFNQQLYDHLHNLVTADCTPVNPSAAERGYWWRLPLTFLTFHFLRHFPAMAGWLPLHRPELHLLTADPEILSKDTSSNNIKDVMPKVKERDREEAC